MSRCSMQWSVAEMGRRSATRYVVAVLSILAILTGCGQSSVNRRTAPSAMATAPVPPGVLAWQPVSGAVPLPFALAPSDGNTAYACQVRLRSPGSTEAVASAEATHDRGAHWRQANDIASGQMTAAQPGEPGYCEMVVDQQQANIAVMVAYWQSMRTGDANLAVTTSIVTFDGGKTWQRLASTQPAIIRAVGTVGNTTYAIREVGVNCGTVCPQPGQTNLMVSTDHMRTWSAVDASLAGPGQTLMAFWLDPVDDQILVELMAGSSIQLWNGLRDQGGQRVWLGFPPVPMFDTVVVQRPTSNPHPWRICGAISGATSNWLTCSSDGGLTWTNRPSLTLTIPPPTGSVPPGGAPKKGGSLPGTLVALADDASVLATLHADPKTGQYSQHMWLYRLDSGASAWQPLGDAPLDAVWYAPAPANGLLWSQQAQGTPEASGSVEDVFTAVYA